MFNFDERVRSSDADDCTLASTSAHEKAGRVLIVLSVFILQLEKNVLKVIPTLVSVPLLLWTANLLHLRRFLKQAIIIDVNWP